MATRSKMGTLLLPLQVSASLPQEELVEKVKTQITKEE